MVHCAHLVWEGICGSRRGKLILKTSAGSDTNAQVSRASDAIKLDDQIS